MTPPNACSTPARRRRVHRHRDGRTVERACHPRPAPGAVHRSPSSASYTPKAGQPVAKDVLTQVGRALAQLGVERIPAYSTEARGRSERLNRTFQDRLVNELRAAGTTTMPTANRYLHDRFLPPQGPLYPCPRRSGLGLRPPRPGRSHPHPLSRRAAHRGPGQYRLARGRALADRQAAGPPPARGCACSSAAISTAGTASGTVPAASATMTPAAGACPPAPPRRPHFRPPSPYRSPCQPRPRRFCALYGLAPARVAPPNRAAAPC